jgi:cell wall-associated NlpC family hydrolase
MTAAPSVASSSRWRRRLVTRQQLLADAREDFTRASTPTARASARARIRLRKRQVAEAKAALRTAGKARTTARERVVRAAMIGVRNRDNISYTQGPKRWEGINRACRAYKGQYPRNADCSSFATWCIWDALGGVRSGADVVNGQRWKAGYTGTQQGHGRVVRLDRARPGDLVFYAGANGIVNHVAVLVAPGRVVSHGSQPGPMVLPVSYRPVREVRSYLP